MTSSTLRFDHLQHQFEENPRRHFVPLAHAFLRAGNAHRAVELCRTFLPQLPGHVSGHVVLAESLRALGAAEEARAEYERVLGLDVENLVAVRALGDLAAERGNAMEARGWYARLVELDPRDASAAARLDELAQAAAEPVAPPYAAVTGAELDERHDEAAEEIESEAPRGGDQDHMLGEEFTAGFFASVLDAPDADASPFADDARFARLDDAPYGDARAGDALPGADELHATLTSTSDGGATRREVHALSSFDPPATDAPAETAEAETPLGWDLAPAATDLEPFAPTPDDDAHALDTVDVLDADDAPPIPSAWPDADAPRTATPTGTPIMNEFAEDTAAAGDLAAERGPAFVTETMADLYVRQGFRDEALAVYRQLLDASPHDERLQARVAELSTPAAPTPSAAMPAVSADADSADAGAIDQVAEHDVDVAPPSAMAVEQGEPREHDEHREPAAAPMADADRARAEVPGADAPVAADAGGSTSADGEQEGDAARPVSVESSGMVEGVAGVDDPTWALAEPVRSAPTVSRWLSSLVAGADDLPLDALAAAQPVADAAEMGSGTARGSDVDDAQVAAAAAAEALVADAPIADAGAADAALEDAPLADVSSDSAADSWTEPSSDAEQIAARRAAEPAEPVEDSSEAWTDEPTAASDTSWGEHVDAGADASLDLTAFDETADEVTPTPARTPSVDAALDAGWPTWDANVLLPDAESDARQRDAAGAGWEATDADVTPFAAAGAGVAPAEGAALRDDEIAEPASSEAGLTASDDAWDDPFAWDDAADLAPAPAAATDEFSLDALFAQPASAADEAAADTLAATSLGLGGDADAAPDLVEAAADDEAGLGRLLRATPPGTPVATASAEPPRGGSFSFEQFFRPTPAAGGPAAPALPSAAGAPASPPPAERDADLDEFHRWLAGLSDS